MPRGHAPAGDAYATVRCVKCFHLRYQDQRRGDPCKVCPCPDHVVPSEVTVDAASS